MCQQNKTGNGLASQPDAGKERTMRSKILILIFTLVLLVSLAAVATPSPHSQNGPDVNAWNHPSHPAHPVTPKENFHGAEMTPAAMLVAGLLGVAAYLGMRHYSRRHA